MFHRHITGHLDMICLLLYKPAIHWLVIANQVVTAAKVQCKKELTVTNSY